MRNAKTNLAQRSSEERAMRRLERRFLRWRRGSGYFKWKKKTLRRWTCLKTAREKALWLEGFGEGCWGRGQTGWILQVGQGNSTLAPIVCQGYLDDRWLYQKSKDGLARWIKRAGSLIWDENRSELNICHLSPIRYMIRPSSSHYLSWYFPNQRRWNFRISGGKVWNSLL